MKRLLPLLMPVALLLMACSRTPGPVLGQEAMARLIADLELANAYALEQRLGNFGSDSMRLVLRESVLAKHGVNEARLDTSLRWYGHNLPRLLEVYDRVDSIIADSLARLDIEEKMAQATAAGDSVNIWPKRLSETIGGGTQFLAFEVETDSTWERGDVVEWTFSVHNLMRREQIRATLAADYANPGETFDATSIARELRDDNKINLTLQLDRQKSAKRIFGFIQIPIDSSRRVFIDSISMTRTRLVDEEYHSRRYRTRQLNRHKGL